MIGSERMKHGRRTNNYLICGLVLVSLTFACGGPFLMIPGGALAGDVVVASVEDWSFVDSAFIDLELRPGESVFSRVELRGSKR